MTQALNTPRQCGFHDDSTAEFTAFRQAPASAPARLLNANQASQYLGFRSIELLKNIPVKPVQLSVVGVGRAPRWDRLALDRWLDTLSGLNGPSPEVSEEGVDAEFDAWKASRHGR